MKKPRKRPRWLFLSRSTHRAMHAKFNVLVRFLTDHFTDTVIFTTILLTATGTQVLSDTLVRIIEESGGGKSWEAAAIAGFLDLTGLVLLVSDCLWLISMVVPFTQGLKNWLKKQESDKPDSNGGGA